MRVLITNSLVLAAISLAPSASAAPYTTASSVESYDSYPNTTTVAQESGPSSVPNVRRDDVIQVQSLYDASPFGSIFGPVAALFGTVGMNTISDSMPLTEAQKVVLDQLHDALHDAAGTVIAHLPADLPISPLSPRSLEDRQLVNPLATLASLPILTPLDSVSDLLKGLGIGPNPSSLTEAQKQVIARLQAAISNAVGDVTANVPVKLDVLPFSHQSRSVEGRSLTDVVSLVNQVPVVSSVLSPILDLISSIGVTNGTPLSDAQKLVLSKLQDAVAVAAQNIESHVPTVHIEHAREEHERWAHDDHHDPHGDDHRSHDAHRDDHKDGHKPQDVHKDGHESPDMRKEDHGVRGADREPRDRQKDERHGREDWKHHKDGNDRDGEPSLLGINLGHSCRP